jgi:hypothetical protein
VILLVYICKVKYRSYETLNRINENLSILKAFYNPDEAEYPWRDVDESAIHELEKRMKVNE